MSIESQLATLTPNEKKVLWWKSQGLKYEAIAEKLSYGIEWVQLHMSSVYVKLGIDKQTHWRKRKKFLQEQVYPLIPDNLEEWIAQTPPEILEVQEIPLLPPPAKIMALVLVDEEMDDEKEKLQRGVQVVMVPQRRTRAWTFLALIVALTLALGYWLGQRSSSTVSSTPEIFTEVPQVTDIPVLSPTLPPLTPSLEPSATFTLEPTATNTSLPTDTVTPYPAGYEFFDDFEDGLDPSWTVILGTPIIANGQLTSTGTTLLSIGDTSWTNYQVEFDVRVQNAPCDLDFGTNSIGVRASDKDNMITLNFGRCATEWNYLSNGRATKIPGTFLRYRDRNVIHIIIRVEGNNIDAHDGSQFLSSFIASDYHTGNIYLKILDDTNGETLYDNFKITILE